MVWKTAGFGVALAAGLAALFGGMWGEGAAFAALVFGLMATGLQSAAVRLMAPVVGSRDPVRLFTRYGAGLGLRMLGVIAIPVAVLAARERFPPFPTALGYIGVIVPLLFYETRLFRR